MTTPAVPAAHRSGGSAKDRPSTVVCRCLVLVTLLLIATILAAAIGSAGIPLHRLAAVLGLAPPDPANIGRDQLILWSIRLPRIAMAAMVGGLLAASGAVMQGLFRNPLADPALVGVSGGAALAAATTIVVSDKFLASQRVRHSVRGAAGHGAARRADRDRLALSPRNARRPHLDCDLPSRRACDRGARQCGDRASGFSRRRPSIARHHILDARLSERRDLGESGERSCRSFWRRSRRLPLIARGLDLLVLGEAEAYHSGIHVQRLKMFSILLIATAVGAAVSVSGVIGFVGIVVPHLLRLVIGPGAPDAAAGFGHPRRGVDGRRRYPVAHAGGAGRIADRDRHRRGRGAVFPGAAACGSGCWPGYDRRHRSPQPEHSRGPGNSCRQCHVARRSRAKPSRWSVRTVPENRACCARCRAKSRRPPGRSCSRTSRWHPTARASLRSNAPFWRKASKWRFPSRSPKWCGWGRGTGADLLSTTRSRRPCSKSISRTCAAASSRPCPAANSSARISRASSFNWPVAKPSAGRGSFCSTSRHRVLTCAISSISWPSSSNARRARSPSSPCCTTSISRACSRTRIVMLQRGRVAADGPVAQTITDDMLQQVFDVDGAVSRTPPAGIPFVLPHGIGTRHTGRGPSRSDQLSITSLRPRCGKPREFSSVFSLAPSREGAERRRAHPGCLLLMKQATGLASRLALRRSTAAS